MRIADRSGSLLVFFFLTLSFACGKTEEEKTTSPSSHRQIPLPKTEKTSIPMDLTPPSPSDGKGFATVSPKEDIIANHFYTWKITYHIAKEGIAVGGGVVMQVSPFWGWTNPQLSHSKSPGYTTIETNSPAARLECFSGDQHYVVATVKQSPLKEGDTVTFIYGNTENGKNPRARAKADSYAESLEEFFIKVDGDGDGHFFPLDQKSQPSFTVLPGPATQLITNSPSIVRTGESFKINIAALDSADNHAFSYTEKVTLSLRNSSEAIRKFSLELSEEDRGAKTLELSLEEPGIYTFTVEDKKNRFVATGNPVLVIKKKPKYHLYWGDLHGHSALSDGTGSPDDYYRYAKEVSHLDVSVLTDHDAWGLLLMDQTPSLWSYIKDITDKYYQPGSFVTFAGYEWTNWKYGHKHVLFLKGERPLLSSRFPDYDTPEKLWKNLPAGEAITISHHPGGGPVGTDWSFSNFIKEPVVEIASIHGNSEKSNSPKGIYHPKPGGFVQDALSKNIKLGILASGDSHNGHPGRRDPQSVINGLAGIYAKKLDREGIWEAINQRRVYGTTGAKIILRFFVNNHFMGEKVVLKDGKVSKQLFSV